MEQPSGNYANLAVLLFPGHRIFHTPNGRDNFFRKFTLNFLSLKHLVIKGKLAQSHLKGNIQKRNPPRVS